MEKEEAVIIFAVDVSRSMADGKLETINEALELSRYRLGELECEENLSVNIAIMSFTSSVRWDVDLCPVNELLLPKLETRAGLTQYGSVFHELNKVLTRDKFMNYTGRIASPLIVFFTDGEPDDDYENDLNELLKNYWFSYSARWAVLMGDVVHSASVQEAVGRFVNSKERIITVKDIELVFIRSHFSGYGLHDY